MSASSRRRDARRRRILQVRQKRLPLITGRLPNLPPTSSPPLLSDYVASDDDAASSQPLANGNPNPNPYLSDYFSGFCCIIQPLVLAIGACDGKWLVAEPFRPVCKPGGHGVIWKLAHDKGVFKWFNAHGQICATVRQKLGFASGQRSAGELKELMS